MMLARNPFLPNPPGARYPTRQEIWPAEQRGGHPQPNDAPAGCRRDAESRARFLAPSTDRRKPAGRRIEWRAVVSARTCVHRGCEECGGANQFGAYGKPPDKCLVTGMTALAKVFKLRQNRLLRYLLPFGILVHRVTPLNQYCGEGIDQLVTDHHRPGDCGRCEVRVLLGIKCPDFLYRELRVRIGKLQGLETETTAKYLAFHQSARPPFD